MNNELKIINYLGRNIGRGYTMHELSKLTGIPYASFYRAIERVKDLLVIERVGRAKTVRLNASNPIIGAHLAISSDEEKKAYIKGQPMIKKIASELRTNDIVILFGSYAKGTQTDKSDIDVLVVNKDGKKSLSLSKYELLFRKKINPIFITESEFKEMLKSEEENVGKQALKSHIILNSPGRFWGCVLNAI